MPSLMPLLRLSIALLFFPLVLAQAPVNDIISWPSGLLLLASILYAALGNAPDRLWEIEPTTGLYLLSGLPRFSIPGMRRVYWVNGACHFVSRVPRAQGKSNFWVPSENVTAQARNRALDKVLSILRPAVLAPLQGALDESRWRVTSIGLIDSASNAPTTPDSPLIKSHSSRPSAHEFLLFAATEYGVAQELEARIVVGGKVVFSTKGLPASAIIDVGSEQQALYVVAAQFVRHPHSQSSLRSLAQQEDGELLALDLDKVDRSISICSVDFDSHAPPSSKVSSSLYQLARAYYRVVQYIKNTVEPGPLSGQILGANVHQALWISIFGGALLDEGRLSIYNLPGRWGIVGVSEDDAYLTRVDAIMDALSPFANTPTFSDNLFYGGLNRHATIPFLIAGLFGQALVCYFLSVGTSAGVWTSVALCNALYAGRLTDLHSVYYGKMPENEEPGMRISIRGTQTLSIVATFDRSTPKEGSLRPGLLLNTIGLIAATCGAVFQDKTRKALGFGEFDPTPSWVIYTSVALCAATSLLITLTHLSQQAKAKTWLDDSELPTRWMTYSTISASLLVSALAIWFTVTDKKWLWPVLDAVTWLSGIGLGVLENGRMFAADENVLHLVLLNRWIMGSVASSVGSALEHN